MSPAGAGSAGETSLVRAIGTLGLAAGIVNITVGGGIFRLPALVAGPLGPAAPVAYLVCATVMGLVVLCVADAGRRVPLTGGPYAYVSTAFGSYAGFLSGVLLWIAGTFATSAVSTVLATSLGQLMPRPAGPGVEAALLVATFTFWSLVNLRGVALAVRLNTIATAAKLLPLLLVVVGGVLAIDPANLRVVAVPAADDVARVSMLLVFAFAGIETALVPSGEVRDAARTVPRAVALAMLGITTLYIALQTVSQGVLGARLAGATSAPLAAVATVSLGGWAGSLLLAGASISIFGYLGGMTLSMPRMLFAMARDGFLPRVLASVHPQYRSPHIAILAQSAVTVVLAVSGTFEKLAVLANVAVLVLYLGCALAAWRLQRLGGETGPVPSLPFARLAPWLATAAIAWLLTGPTAAEWLAFTACVAAASLAYVVARRAAG